MRSSASPGKTIAMFRSRALTLRTLLPLTALLGAVLASPRAASAQAGEPPLPVPECKAASAILVDASTGTVLWEKASHVRRPMASTTKIMTAALALETARLDDVVTFSEHARLTPYANLNAKPKEQFRMRDMLYAMLLRSSNDGCVAVAEHLAGSAWRYATMMTEKARQLGATDTSFVTVNGLYDKNHYSTAADLALIARYAIQNPVFNEIVATRSALIDRTLNPKDRLIVNHNKFLSRYQGADGIKTGYVKESGRCLVASATTYEGGNPWRLITVVLNSGDTYGDSARLMDWGKKYFQPVYLAKRGDRVTLASVRDGIESDVPLVAADDLTAIVRRRRAGNPEVRVDLARDLRAPVQADQIGGMLVATVDGRPVAEVNLVAARPVSQVWTASVAPWTGWWMAFAALLMVPRYARAFGKSARRRRRRLAARRGAADPGR
jgi:D-alanyl-D-alanine carboxypeptidase (penicillin-binding protein 5/6)